VKKVRRPEKAKRSPMSRARRVGSDIADRYLGQEANIPMGVEDARYRYYQWLREWYGFGKQEDTHKCPFYQFMFWGSILMLVSLVPIIIMKILDFVILKPLAWIVPEAVNRIDKQINKSKMVTSWLITICLFVIALAIAGLWSGAVLFWIGFVVHVIFAIPLIVLRLVWLGIGVLFTDALPWLFWGIIFVLSWVFDFLAACMMYIINWPWLSIGIFFLWAIGTIIALCAVVYIGFRIGVFIFKSRFSAWAIKKSCIIRENQLKKRKDRKVRIAKTQNEKAEVRYQWEKEHREEVAKKERLKQEKKRLKYESKEDWREFRNNAGNKLWAFLKVFPGFIFVGLWYALKYVGLAFWHVGIAFGWVFEKIGDFFVIVWSLLTETISNHCPPIDFVMDSSDTGRLKIYDSREYIFECDNKTRTLIISNNLFPAGFKLIGTKAGKRGSITCTITTKELDENKRWWVYKYDYTKLVYPVRVYAIQDIKYDLPKPRKKKAVKKPA
jgi:hypothetical protein